MHAVLCNCARNILSLSISKFLLMKLLYILELIGISMYAIVYYHQYLKTKILSLKIKYLILDF
jgi:hypothetical protein